MTATVAVPGQQPLEDWEKGWPLRPGWPWWLHLLVFGHAAPIPDKEVQEMKEGWFDPNTNDKARATMLAEIQERFKERQSSTLDTFVKLTIIAALIVVVPGTAHEILDAAQKITISGEVQGDVRSAAQQVRIEGAIAGSISIIAQQVDIAERHPPPGNYRKIHCPQHPRQRLLYKSSAGNTGNIDHITGQQRPCRS